MAGRRIVYLASVIGCLVFYYFYREWLSWLFLTILVALPWLSLLLTLPALLTVRAELEVAGAVTAGQECSATVRLISDIPAPSFRYKFRVANAITGEKKTLKPGQPLPTAVCGRLTVASVPVGVYDYLGLFCLPLRKKPQATVYVWPDAVPLSYEPDFARRPPKRWKPKPGGGFAENHELRLYRPGDNLQQIHWKLTAKTGKLILRESMVPIHQALRLTLDLSGTAEEINRKLGRLLWLSRLLLEKEIPFQISALTGNGILTWEAESENSFNAAMTELLSTPASQAGTLKDNRTFTGRTYHIGGGLDEE